MTNILQSYTLCCLFIKPNSHFHISQERRPLVVQVGHSQDLSLAKPTLCYGDLLGYYHLTGHADEHHHDEEEDGKDDQGGDGDEDDYDGHDGDGDDDDKDDHDGDGDEEDKHRTVKEEENCQRL